MRGWRKPAARAAAESLLGVHFATWRSGEATVEWLEGGRARVRGRVAVPGTTSRLRQFYTALDILEENGGTCEIVRMCK